MPGVLRFYADTKYLRDTFDRLRNAGLNPQPLLQRYGEKHMREIPARAVREQRSPEGLRPWLPITRGPRAGKPALRQTGELVRAFRNARITATSRSVRMEPRPNRKRFWIHQTGGTIRPRRAKYLAIPLTPEARRAGSARQWWKNAEAAGRRPFVWKSRNGNLLLGYRRPRAGLTPMFLLKLSVRIPARPFLGFGARDKKEFVRMAREYLAKHVRRS